MEIDLRGDCSIQIDDMAFDPRDIAECSGRTGLLSFEIELEPSGRCSCAACRASASVGAALDPTEIRSLAVEAKAIGCRRCLLLEHQTIPHPRLTGIIDDLLAEGMQVELFSDGAGLDPATAKFLCDRRVAVHLRLDSLDPDRQDALSNRRGAWASIQSAFSNLREAGYAKAGGPVLSTQTSVGPANLEELPGLWRWARANGAEPELQVVTPMRLSDPSGKGVAPERMRQLLEELARIDAQEFGREWKRPASLAGRACKRLLYACHISSCGQVFPCAGIDIPLGNVRTESLATILETSEVLENVRAFENKVKEPCRTCSKSTDCFGCRGAAYQATGDYLAGDALCWKAQGQPIQSLPVEVAELIPHGPSIRAIDKLVMVGERQTRTELLVSKDSVLVDSSGRLDDTAYIEIIAQSFAASHGFHLSAQERPLHSGLLIGVRDLSIVGDAWVGDRLNVLINKISRFGDFGVVEGTVHNQDGKLIASGQVKVWRPNAETVRTLMQ